MVQGDGTRGTRETQGTRGTQRLRVFLVFLVFIVFPSLCSSCSCLLTSCLPRPQTLHPQHCLCRLLVSNRHQPDDRRGPAHRGRLVHRRLGWMICTSLQPVCDWPSRASRWPD